MRTVTAAGEALIRRMEGLRLEAYVCPAGVLTIGYGHTGPDVRPRQRITAAEAEARLQRDLERTAAAVERLITVPLSDPQFAALVSFTFNVGPQALEKSTLRRRLNQGQYDAVPEQLMRWTQVRDPETRQLRVSSGLVRRRRAEIALWQTPADGTGPETAMPQAVAAADGRTSLVASRTMRAGGVAGTAVVGATALTALQDMLGEAQGTLAELLPYLDQVKLVLLLLALAGIALTLYARWDDWRAGRR